MIDRKLVHDPHMVANGGGSYYERLATPACNTDWNDDFLQLAESLVDTVTEYYFRTKPMIEIRPEAVREAINSLNKGKAADPVGIQAEHLATGQHPLIHCTYQSFK